MRWSSGKFGNFLRDALLRLNDHFCSIRVGEIGGGGRMGARRTIQDSVGRCFKAREFIHPMTHCRAVCAGFGARCVLAFSSIDSFIMSLLLSPPFRSVLVVLVLLEGRRRRARNIPHWHLRWCRWWVRRWCWWRAGGWTWWEDLLFLAREMRSRGWHFSRCLMMIGTPFGVALSSSNNHLMVS